MKNIFNKLLFLGVLSVISFSCEIDDPVASEIASFESFTIDASSLDAFGNVPESTSTYTVKFLMPSAQNSPITLTVRGSEASEAEEDVDFIIIDHDISLDAYTTDSISIDIQVLDDYISEEDESIVLTIAGSYGAPMAIDVEVGTIIDNGKTKGTDIDFTLSWSFDDASLSGVDPCSIVNDMDLIINTVFSYTGDLLGNVASTLACPETAPMLVEDLPEDEVYNIYVVVWAGIDLGAASDMTLNVAYTRDQSDLNGSFNVSGFSSLMSGQGGAIATIERDGETVTIKDTDGNTIQEGSIRPDLTLDKLLDNVKNAPLK